MAVMMWGQFVGTDMRMGLVADFFIGPEMYQRDSVCGRYRRVYYCVYIIYHRYRCRRLPRRNNNYFPGLPNLLC